MSRYVRLIFAAALSCFFMWPVSVAQEGKRSQKADGEFINLLGKQIWYESAGQGQPLLLIPGAGGSHDYFRPFFAPLERSFRVIYFDGFGRGKSERAKSPSEYTFEHDLDEIEALRQALHLGKIAVYGHSYGGFVAEAYALKYPGSVSKLVISNIFICSEDFQASDDHMNEELKQFFPELWVQIVQLRARGVVSSAPEMQQATSAYFIPILEHFYFYNPQNAPQIAKFWNEDNFSQEQWNAVAGDDYDLKIERDLAKLDFRPRLASIKAPVLVIAGRHDGIVLPSLTVKFKQYAPQAQFVMFEHSGHYPFVEEAPLFLKTLQDFLK